MSFAAPWFLLAVLPIAALWIAATRSRAPLPRGQRRLVTALQGLAMLCAALALAAPWRSGPGAVHRIAIVAGDGMAGQIAAWRAQVPHGDPFLVISAGAEPEAGAPGRTEVPAANGAPDLAAGLRAALATIPAGAASEITLFCDGSHDGAELAALAAEFGARPLRLHVRWSPAGRRAAVAVTAIEVPARTAPGESFRLIATIDGGPAGGGPTPVPLEVWAADALLGSRAVTVRPGLQRHVVDCVLERPGLHELEVRLSAARQRSAVLVDEPLTVLHLAPEPSRRQALAATLAPHGIATVAPEPASTSLLPLLQRSAAVLVDDLPADAWPAAEQELLRDAVLQRGTGLLLSGTHANLGPGGYAGSPLAPLLPVRMPQREERRDPSISLVLIVDTSGSMGGGRVELAKEVARLAVQKLQPHDKVGIIEFYGSKRWAAPLQPATNTIEITRALNRLQVGGGTIIYDALEEAYYALLNARTRFQHILVLTDGGVESGPFEALARRMAAAGQTLSTVLIGPQANSPFLLNLAQWGRGRFYACPDRFQLPELQFREPQSALLPAVQERRLPLLRSAEAEAVAAFAGDEITPSGGLVEAAARRGAEVLLRGLAGEPYLVGWDQGLGRVLVLAGQTLGPHTGELRADPAYSAFLADLLRSAGAGQGALQPQLRLAAQARGARVQLVLPAGTHLLQPPTIAAGRGPTVSLVPQDASTFAAFVPWPDQQPTVFTAVCGSLVLARAAAVAPLPVGGSDARSVLERLAELTAGTVAEAAVPIPATALAASRPQVEPLARPLALAALIAFLLALLLRRLPFERIKASGAGPLLLLVVVALPAAAARAQEPADEAAIRAAIDGELRQRGDLDALAERWRDGSQLQRLLLALARGDLAAATAACEAEPLVSAKAALRVDLLDVRGQPQAALEALAALPGGTAVERSERALRAALLLHAAGRHDEARAELRRAAEPADLPAAADRAGLLAGSLGYHDVALALHRVGTGGGRLAYQAALRRGLWQLRRGEPRAAMAEYEAAFACAPLQRDRYFALAQLVAAARVDGSLPELADAWLARVRGGAPAMTVPELHVLLEVLRELGRAREGLSVLASLDPAARRDLETVALDLALAAGDPEVAVDQLRARLEAAPGDAVTRSSLAVLLADLQRDQAAAQVLLEGIERQGARELRLLVQTASELGFDDAVARLAAAIANRIEAGGAAEGALLMAAHERRQGRDERAAAQLLQARSAANRPADQLRIAEQLESLGRTAEAIDLYRTIYAATGTEDLGLRLAWLLSGSRRDADRQEAQAIFRRIWTTAGSAARRVQAEEQVLDLAAREGTLADLAIELEQQLLDPATPNRPALRDALVKIYSRARDTFGAVQFLRQWAREEPTEALAMLEQEARIYLGAEEFGRHERALLELLQRNPRDEIEYRQQLAMSALERGRPADAHAYLRGFLDRPGAQDQVAIEFAAGVYALAGLHDEAVRLYRRALALHPERVETFLLLGNALRSAGQRERAIGTFQELLLRPLPDDLFVVAVDGLLNMEAPSEVLAAAMRAVRLRLSARPDQVFLHRVLQDLLEAAGDEPGRLRQLEDTVIAGGEQRTSFVRELMQEAESRRDWRTYAQHGRTLLLLGDEVPPAVFLSLGEALLQLGDLDAATRAFARARLAHDFASVEVRIAELYENAERLAEAERVRRRILRRRPGDADAMLAVARLAERQGARERALPLYVQLAGDRLQQELPAAARDASRPGGARAAATRVLPLAAGRNTASTEVPFAEVFAGTLRCAASLHDVEPLLEILRRESSAGAGAAADRRAAALQLLRRLALSFADDALRREVWRGEDELLAGGNDARLQAAIAMARIDAGELDLAAALLEPLPAAADDALRWQQLRLLMLRGDQAGLRSAAAATRSSLLPDLVRMLLLAGHRDLAASLLDQLAAAALADPDGAGAAAVAAHRHMGRPFDDAPLQQRRLQLALQSTGPLPQRVAAVLAAMRAHRGLDRSERSELLQRLAAEVLGQRDAAQAERLLADNDGALPEAVETQLVELLFSRVDQVFQIGARARHLAALPAERGLEVLRGALRRFPPEEQRQQYWRILQNPGNLSVAFLLGVLEGMSFDRLSPTDRTMLSILTTRVSLPAEAQALLAKRVQGKLPDDISAALMRARLETTPDARRTTALQSLQQLAQRRSLDARDGAALDGLLAFVPRADTLRLLEELPADGPLLLRVALLRRTGQKIAAAEAIVAAYQQRPDDVSLLFQAARFLEGEGMLQRAAELYRIARDRSATWYPHQAQQLARIEIELGDFEAALASLQSARDPLLSSFRAHLAALAGIGDAARRATVLRGLLQRRSARGRTSMAFFRPARGGDRQDRLAAAMQPPGLPQPLPDGLAAFDDAASDHDLLAWLPEGESCARDLLRTLTGEERDNDPGLYRGLLGSARRAGRADALLADAIAVLRQQPADAEALRVVLAAAQLGMPVPGELLRAAMLRRIGDRRLDAAALVELLAVALQAGDHVFAERIAQQLLSSRGELGDARLRQFLPGVVARVPAPSAGLLLALAPGEREPLLPEVDAELLAALLRAGDAAAAVKAWRPAMTRWLDDRSGSARIGLAQLPWCGLLLATGDVEGAAAALVALPELVLQGGATHLLGAALPPLERWEDPAAAGRIATVLLAGAATGLEERRSVFARLGAVLVARLRAAGEQTAAADLQQRVLAATGDLAWRAADWFPAE